MGSCLSRPQYMDTIKTKTRNSMITNINDSKCITEGEKLVDRLCSNGDKEELSIEAPTNDSFKVKVAKKDIQCSGDIQLNASIKFIDRREIEDIEMNQSTFIDRNQMLLHQNPRTETLNIPVWALSAVHSLGKIDYSQGTDVNDENIEVSDSSDSEQDFESRLTNAVEINSEDIIIDQPVGQGHFGTVYKAKWEGNCVVVKHLNTDNRKEIEAEIALASSLPHHFNVVTFYGYVQNPFGLVMDYMAGGSVEQYVYRKYKKADNTIPTIIQLIIILRKVANGLRFLHSNGLVHRDIAARNILLGSFVNAVDVNTEVKISDFGLSLRIKDKKGIIKSKTNMGPLLFMAPESIEHKQYSKKSDVYMFAMTMYEMFYGREPYFELDASIADIATNVATKQQRPEIINNPKKYRHCAMPPEYLALMQLCWKQSPKERPAFDDIFMGLEFMETNLL